MTQTALAFPLMPLLPVAERSAEHVKAIALLRSAGFVVVEPFVVQDVYAPYSGRPLRIGTIVDTETTGTDPLIDRVVELAMVSFTYDPSSGEVHEVLDVFTGMQDPGMPISEGATKTSGITDDMVAGKSIDPAVVDRFAQRSHIFIAHNAGFDRPFCEKEGWKVFETKPWACSVNQVTWDHEGYGSAKQEWIAYKRGFHYPAHRAEIDARALLHILQAPLAVTGRTTLLDLLGNAREKTLRIWATDAPYETKDALKSRGYSWRDGTNGTEKAWMIEVKPDAYPAEIEFLQREIYVKWGKPVRGAKIVVDEVDAHSRFSHRRVATSTHLLGELVARVDSSAANSGPVVAVVSEQADDEETSPPTLR